MPSATTTDEPHRTVPVDVIESAGPSPEELAEILAAHDRALATGEGVLKDGRRTAVTRVEHASTTLCVKEYRSLGFLDRFKDLLRGSRAVLAWRGAAFLTSCGITTPKPVAVVQRGEARYLITRLVEDAVPLNRLLADRFDGDLPPAELAAKRRMVRHLGRWLRRVHDQDVYHDDWSTKNILCREREGGWEFFFLDLESLPPYKRLTWRRRAKNLGQLNDAPFGITRTDRMRFLLAYSGDDRALTRGRFPRAVLAFSRRRADAWAKVQERAAKRREQMRVADHGLRIGDGAPTSAPDGDESAEP